MKILRGFHANADFLSFLRDGHHGGGDPDIVSRPPSWGSLDFRIERLVCNDETNGEAGADEISCGGVAFHGPGAVSGVPNDDANVEWTQDTFDAGDFRTGDARSYNPAHTLHSYDLSGSASPHIAAMMFVLAETDPAGGFDGYLIELANGVSGEFFEGAWAGFAASAGIMGATAIGVGAMGGPIGLLIGSIVAAVGLLIVALLDANFGNYDEYFEAFTAILVISPETLQGFPFYGTDQSESFAQTVLGDGGSYDVIFHWKLRDFDPGDPGDQDPPGDADG